MGVVLSNSVCLTDAQLQGEVATMVAQTGILEPHHARATRRW